MVRCHCLWGQGPGSLIYRELLTAKEVLGPGPLEGEGRPRVEPVERALFWGTWSPDGQWFVSVQTTGGEKISRCTLGDFCSFDQVISTPGAAVEALGRAKQCASTRMDL